MQFKTKIIPYTLHFKRPAGTSRGVYHDHRVWYVLIYSPTHPQHWGVGECAPLVDLSCDYDPNYEDTLCQFCHQLEQTGQLDYEALRAYPSILFGLETALRHYQNQSFILWDSAFSRGDAGIPINGLIWMGDFGYMYQQIEDKLAQGFTCIKLKIGAIDFEQEIELLRRIRTHFSAQDVTLRVDANGAFAPHEALEKLKRLSEFDLHSIEQPIPAGQWDEMAQLTYSTPLPIALDEELIGIHQLEQKRTLLETIRPQYIILKPTLHGGIKGCEEWIASAQNLNIGWWVTSALESNIGLNAIAQWCATFNNPLPQGLGTGLLYTNNVEMPLVIEKDRLWHKPNGRCLSKNEIISLCIS